MSEIRIKYSDISSSCSNLTSLASKLDETITSINSSIAMITDPTWDGAAAQNYVEKIKKLANNLPDAKVQLASAVLFLASCADGYQSIDKEQYKKLVDLVGGQSYIDSYDVSKAPVIDLSSRVTTTTPTPTTQNNDDGATETTDYVESGYDDDSSGGGSHHSSSSDDGASMSLSDLMGTAGEEAYALGGITSAISGSGILDITGEEITTLKEGEELEIPSSITQSAQSITGFDANLKTSEEKTYSEEEKKVVDKWKEQGSVYTNGIATVKVNDEDRYLVSVSPKFGKVGDSIDISMNDGSVVKCVISENKNINSSTSSSVYGDLTDSGEINIVNYEVSSEKYKELGDFSKDKWQLDWDPTSSITKIKNNGSILDNSNAPTSNENNTPTSNENTESES